MGSNPLFAAGDGARALRDEALIARLEQSFQLFIRPDVDRAGRFYERLFARYPELRPLFPGDLTQQKIKFLQTLAMIVENLRAPDIARARLAELGRSHLEYGALEAHYEMVCAEIVATMAMTAGSQWTVQLGGDWREVMRQESAVMIEAARSTDRGA